MSLAFAKPTPHSKTSHCCIQGLWPLRVIVKNYREVEKVYAIGQFWVDERYCAVGFPHRWVFPMSWFSPTYYARGTDVLEILVVIASYRHPFLQFITFNIKPQASNATFTIITQLLDQNECVRSLEANAVFWWTIRTQAARKRFLNVCF